MATANRDVKMTLSIETLGEEGIKDLQKSISNLAKEGGEAAPEFQHLADEIGRLGEQNQALSAFTDLAEATRVLSDRQAEAQASSTKLSTGLDGLRASADAARTKQQQAADALLAGQKANVDAAVAIRTLKVEYDNAGKQTSKYRTHLSELIAAQGRSQAELIDLRNAQKQANTEVVAAEAAQRKAETAYTRSASALDRANTALAENTAAAAAAAKAAQALDIATDDIAGAQTQLITSLNAAGTAAQTLKTETQELAQASERTAQAQRELAAASQAGMAAMQQEVSAALALNASFEAMSRSVAEYAAEQARAEQQTRQQAAAADELTESDRLLAIEQQGMNNLMRRGADALDAERAALREAAQTTNLYVTQKRAQVTADQAAAAATKAAADQVQAAFNTLNVRSADTIQAELVQVRAALETVRAQATQTGSTMAGAFTAGQARVNALQLELRQLNGTLTLGDKAAGLFKNSLGQIAAGNVIADGVGYLVNKVKEAGREFLEANLQVQRFTKALTQVYGDAGLAAKQLAFVRETANGAGVSVASISDAFVRFSASTKTANLSLDDSNRIFAAVTRAAGTLGLTGEQVTGTLEALGQMASKGTVSMEELRQQLGDRLPGALGVAAKSLGVTSERLIEMVESGNVSAKVFLPAFAEALSSTFGGGTEQITGFIQGWNRLGNAIREVAQRASETSIFTTLGGVFDATARNIDKVVLGVTLLAERFLILKAIDLVTTFARTSAAAVQNTAVTAANTVATAANTAAKAANSVASTVLATSVNAATAAQASATAATGLFGRSLGALGSAAGAAGGAVRGLTSLVGGLPGVLALVLLNAKELGTWLGESIAKMGEAGENMRVYEESMRKQAEAEKLAADTKRQLTLEQDRQNLATAEGAVRARKAAEAQVTSSEATVKARQAEAQVSGTLAAISGREIDALNAAAAASQGALVATQAVTTAKQNLVLRTQEEIAAIELTRDANGKLTEKQQEQVTELKELLATRQQEALEAKATADSLALEAIQRRLLAELYQDNSGRLEELNQKYRDAVLLLETLRLSGVATAEQLAQANAKVGASSRLVADGYADTARNISAENEVKQANINITRVQAEAQGASYQKLAQSALASGDLGKAIYYEVEAKRSQIRITQLGMQAKLAEVEATNLQIDANYAELKAKGPLTAAQEKEIEARRLNAQAKKIEAEAIKDLIRAQEAEISVMLANRETRTSNLGSINADTDSRHKNADAILRQNKALAEQKPPVLNKDGSMAGTFNNTLPMNKIYEILAKKEAGTLTAEDLAGAEEALAQASNARDFLSATNEMRAGSVDGRTLMQTGVQQTLLRDIVAGLKGPQAAGAAEAAGTPAGTASAPPGRTAGSSHTVKVEIGGRSRTVNTASASDASALVAMLRDLETAAGRAS